MVHGLARHRHLFEGDDDDDVEDDDDVGLHLLSISVDLDVALAVLVVDVLVLVVQGDEGLHVASMPLVDLGLRRCCDVRQLEWLALGSTSAHACISRFRVGSGAVPRRW